MQDTWDTFVSNKVAIGIMGSRLGHHTIDIDHLGLDSIKDLSTGGTCTNTGRVHKDSISANSLLQAVEVGKAIHRLPVLVHGEWAE